MECQSGTEIMLSTFSMIVLAIELYSKISFANAVSCKFAYFVYIQLCFCAVLMDCLSESTKMRLTSSCTCSNLLLYHSHFLTTNKTTGNIYSLSYSRLSSSEVMFLNSYVKDLFRIRTIFFYSSQTRFLLLLFL